MTMKKFWDKIKKFYYFKLANPVVRVGEKGGFKWKFRRFFLEIESLSGNFKARFFAGEHPYGYLISGKDDSNIEGFCTYVYMLSHSITTDQALVNDIKTAFKNYLERAEAAERDDSSEEAAIEEVRGIQEYVEKSPKERRKYDRDVNGRFKKAIKAIDDN